MVGIRIAGPCDPFESQQICFQPANTPNKLKTISRSKSKQIIELQKSNLQYQTKMVWSWGSAFAGAACASATLTAMWARPRNPTFHLVSISLSSFHLNLPLLDLELMLTVHVTNPNPVAIQYEPALISISYSGTHLGTAQLEAGSQSANSCEILQLSARLDGLEMAHHAKALLADVARRSMVLDSTVDIKGFAQVWWWTQRFSVHIDSHAVVDPVFLDVVEQKNQSETQVLFA